MKAKLQSFLPGLMLFSTLIHAPSTAFAQGTAFTYQGRLNDGGVPANGTYDLLLTIYDLPTGPGAFANQTNSAVAISNGLFTVTLDFGPGIFTGPERWLEIAVRTNGGGAFANLAPRQKITATPYAIAAGNVTGSVLASQLSGSISPANISAGTITSTMLAAGSVTTSNLADGAVSLAKLNTVSTLAVSSVIANPTPAIDDYFGISLAAVGADKVVINSYWENPGIVGAGAVYLFNANGALLTTITNPFPVAEDFFGNVVDGVGTDKIIIGAFQKEAGLITNAGAAYLYNTSGNLLTTFTNPTPALNDEFGHAVAGVGTNKVLIGARYDDTGATNAGSAYLYSLNGTLLVTFTNPTPALDEWFGYHVAAVGSDKVLISAVLDSTFATNAGAAYLFSTTGALLTTFTNPMPAQALAFGITIAAAGNDRVLVTAVLTDITNRIVFLFGTNGTLLKTFGPAESFGDSLAWMGPDKVIIGAPNSAGTVGTVYVFNTDGTSLGTIANPNPVSGANFGYALAAAGDKIAIGVPLDNTGAVGSGVAYLFGIGAQYIPGLVGDGSFAANPGNIAIDSSRSPRARI